MPISRYEIRNEYSLADPELYRDADKDDPEALLEGVAMAGLVGVLRQLGDLAEFAAEIFHDLHEEVMVTAARGHSLVVRVQQLEAEVPTIEKAFLSQTDHSPFLYNPGVVNWHPNQPMEQNLVTRGDLPRFIMDSYEECRGPPRLFLLDKFDTAGAGACLKRYTDPSFFKVETSSSRMNGADVQREKKNRKAKKKGARWRSDETSELLPTSHAKLHQLFMEEPVGNGVNNPARRVKLKRRMNGFPFDLRTGKSYMEKLLKTTSSESNHLNNSGLELLEVKATGPDRQILERKRSPPSSPDREDIRSKPFNYEPDWVSTDKFSNINGSYSSTEKDIAVVGESKPEVGLIGYISDDISSEIDNYVDAPMTMESEIDTDTEIRAKSDDFISHVKRPSSDEEQFHPHSSDSQSTGNSTVSDNGNNSSKKDNMSSFSSSDSPSTSADSANSEQNSVSAGEFPSGHKDVPVSPRSKSVVSDSEFPNSIVHVSDTDPTLARFDSGVVLGEAGSRGSVSDEKSCTSDQEEKRKNLDTDPTDVSDSESKTGDDSPRSTPPGGHAVDSNVAILSDFLHNDDSDADNLKGPDTNEKRSISDAEEEDTKNPAVDPTCSPYVSDFKSRSGDNSTRSSFRGHVEDKTRSDDETCLHTVSDNTVEISSDFLHEDASVLEDPRRHELDEKSCDIDVEKKISDFELQTGNNSQNEGHLVDKSNSQTVSCDQENPEQDENVASISKICNGLPHSGNDSPQVIATENTVWDGFDDGAFEWPENVTSDNPVISDKGDSGVSVLPIEEKVIDELDHEDQNAFFDAEDNDSNRSVANHVDPQNSLTCHVESSEDRPGEILSAHDREEVISDGVTAVNETPKSCELVELQVTVSTAEVSSHDSEASPKSSSTPENFEGLAGPPDTVENDGIALCTSPNGQEARTISLYREIKWRSGVQVLSDETYFGTDNSETKVLATAVPRVDHIADQGYVGSPVPQDKLVEEKLENDTLDFVTEQKSCLKSDLVSEVVLAPSLPTDPDAEEKTLQELTMSRSDTLGQGFPDSSEINSGSSLLDFHTPLVSELPPQINYEIGASVHSKDPLGSMFPPRNLLFEPHDVNPEDLPPLPPLPPVQWRMGKVGLPSFFSTEGGDSPQHKGIFSQGISTPFAPTGDVSSTHEESNQSHVSISSDIASREEKLEDTLQHKEIVSEETSTPFAATADVRSLHEESNQRWRMGKLSQPSFFATEGGDRLQHKGIFSQGTSTPFASTGDVSFTHEESNRSPVSISSDIASREEELEDTLQHREIVSDATSTPFPPTVDVSSAHEESSQSLILRGEEVEHVSSILDANVTRHETVHLEPKEETERTEFQKPAVEDGIQITQNIASTKEESDHSSSSFKSSVMIHETVDLEPKTETKEPVLILPSPDSEFPLPAAEEGTANGSRTVKLPRPRNPLFDTAAALDKSKLRKVTERVRPEIQKDDERDSLLEQIRTKSFNLKPALAARPSIRGPKTNLKVAAILEKANAIRQAFAGSDEDDEDNWSDS